MMFSMAIDEYAIKRQLGTTVVTIPIEEFYDAAKQVPEAETAAYWADLKSGIGPVTASWKSSTPGLRSQTMRLREW
jgi:hypothetical protein